MTTDSDLRSTLLDAVDAEVDVTAFRARLDRAIAGQDSAGGACGADTATSQVPPGGGTVFELHRETSSGLARRGRRASSAIAVAACLAAIAALAWVVVVHTSRTPPAHRSAPTPVVRHVLGSALFPGSIVIGVFHGTGSQTVPFPAGHATPARHQQYMALLACSSGPFELAGAHQSGRGTCDGGATGGSLSRSDNSVHVHVNQDTSWRLAIVIEPDLRTNGGVTTGGSIGVQRAPIHRGNGTVTFPRPHGQVTDGPGELVMTCRGSGFRLTGMNGAVHGDYTHTCFPGFAYTWDFNRVHLPATLHVHAAPGTTWTARLW